ncbi:glycosyltransferase family 20 protein [Plicaturopsis crispa FD-325 SS-3]|uniref:Glycosyltransferase family 20 protein n=1 Tax=Plicaturopsis crispa FD-325 SS-3 TaxID=944288 RepID=A0A0C9T3E6_PLICR|nr:glycosyltransferase family 20 protein [Plicaturopsis crispa FD-325 SS-3]
MSSNSLRNHRVIVASLFLPKTAVLGESPPPTPPTHNERETLTPPISLPEATFRNEGKPPVRPSTKHMNTATVNVPLRSIIDDLKDKTRAQSKSQSASGTPSIGSPGSDKINFPFLLDRVNSTLNAISEAPPARPFPTSRKAHMTHTEHIPSRVQRKHSRSSSRRGEKDISQSAPFNQPWHFEPNPHCNGGLKNAVQSAGDKLRRKLWVGALGTETDSFSDGLRSNIDRRMLQQCDSLPVWIPDAEFESCYDEFCHQETSERQVLWPCLHYAIPDAPKTKLFYESASYKQYVAVNRRFADVIIANYQEGDIVWVNDYHLMLLPQMLRSSPDFPQNAPIGFFMHVAFPSSEIFRCLSVRESLLRGLLDADLVGFQTASYARHFRQTVSRILSLEALPKGIQVEGGGNNRFVDVGVFPMGIDVAALTERKREPEVLDWVQSLKQRYAGMKIVVGRDKLDEIQGVKYKIKAFEAFLDKYKEFQGKVVLIQVALQTTESNELAGDVADTVSHINSRFSTLTYQPVVFLHTQDLTFAQYLALLTVADAFLVTSLREGMALRTHEFVECQEDRHRPLILSEFTGSYSYSGFRSCIAINPWDIRGTAKAIHQALTMSDDEATSRWEDLHNHVVTQTAQAFVSSFLTRCLRASTEHLQADLSAVPRLDIARLLPKYRHSRKRLLLIDLESTIWKRDLTREGLLKPFSPPDDVIALLNKLASDPKNQVWLLSGLPVKGKLDTIAEKVPKIGIVAENGCFLKTAPTRHAPSTWINMVSNFNLTWKSACVEILNYFTERTPGSFVEDREASIVWRFWTDPEDAAADNHDFQWARRQAAEAQNHIFDSLGERYGLRIIPGKNSFLVLPNNISRSTAVGAILHPGGPAHSPLTGRAAWMTADNADLDSVTGDIDLVFAIGTDEKLLRRLNDIDNAETCSVSEKGTDAKWKLEAKDAAKILWQLAGAV